MQQVQDLFCTSPAGLRICYRTYGESSGTPLMLIAGLGLQLIAWPARLIDQLVAQGYFVITLDNRDAGRSDRVDAPPPSVMQQLLRRPGDGYELGDMALDAVAVLDVLDIERAHVVGMSMGGMIAQTVAARFSRRTQSLTSIFSTTGAPRVGQPTMPTLLKLVASPAARTRDEAINRYVAITRHIGPTTYHVSHSELQDYAGQAWDRGLGTKDAEATARQIGAIMRSGDRTAELAKVKAPTLVIHGHRDPLVHHSGGVATARAIKGARLITMHGMGHYLPQGALPHLVDLITGHTRRCA